MIRYEIYTNPTCYGSDATDEDARNAADIIADTLGDNVGDLYQEARFEFVIGAPRTAQHQEKTMTRAALIATMTAPFDATLPGYERDVEAVTQFVSHLPEAQFAELAQKMDASLREYGFEPAMRVKTPGRPEQPRRGRGRPELPPSIKRAQIAGRVTPETAAFLSEERARTGKSLGALLDDAVSAYRGLESADG